MSDIVTTALGGINAAFRQAERAAQQIATAPAGDVNMAEAAIDLKQAELQAKLGAAVIKTAHQMDQDLFRALDIKV